MMLRDRSMVPLSHQLCVLTDRSLAEDSSAGNVAQLAQRAVQRYEIELRNHFELEELTALLRTHIRKEESQLFEDIQKRLPRETLDAMGAEFDATAVRTRL